MTIRPETPEDYPDPDEASDSQARYRIDTAELGMMLSIREWVAADGLVEQFAIVLDVTPDHPSYLRCIDHKSGQREATQVRRTDTWDSEVHSHQHYIDCKESTREGHEKLYGGKLMEQSRAAVNASFYKYQMKYAFDPFSYIDRWEAGKNG